LKVNKSRFWQFQRFAEHQGRTTARDWQLPFKPPLYPATIPFTSGWNYGVFPSPSHQRKCIRAQGATP
jgi:hypothetical protein